MTLPIGKSDDADLARCQKCQLHSRGLCSGANGESLTALNKITHIQKCSAGESILAEGDSSELVGNVISGVLKITKILADGREQIVGLLFPSDFFGRVYTSSSEFTIEAATDATICSMNRKAFERLIEEHHSIEHQLLKSTFNELDAAREWIVLLGCQSTLEKVASFFLMLLRRSDNICRAQIPYKDGVVVVFPISRNDIVAYLGTTVETLSRQIQHLSRQGAIRVLDAKHFEILDKSKLEACAGEVPHFWDSTQT